MEQLRPRLRCSRKGAVVTSLKAVLEVTFAGDRSIRNIDAITGLERNCRTGRLPQQQDRQADKYGPHKANCILKRANTHNFCSNGRFLQSLSLIWLLYATMTPELPADNISPSGLA